MSMEKPQPVLFAVASATAMFATYVVSLCVMEQKTPTQLFAPTATRPATIAQPVVGGMPTYARRNTAMFDGPKGIADKKTGQYQDIDGKGNVYAIEPKMAVEDSKAATSRLLIGGAVGAVAIAVALASLGTLSSFEPEQGDYRGAPLSELSAKIQSQI